MSSRRFDHLDLRVSSLAEALPFYQEFLPALGFTRVSGEGDFFPDRAGPRPSSSGWSKRRHRPSENRNALWADSREEVNRVAKIVADAGGRVLEGPELCVDYSPDYFAFSSRIHAATAGNFVAGELATPPLILPTRFSPSGKKSRRSRTCLGQFAEWDRSIPGGLCCSKKGNL